MVTSTFVIWRMEKASVLRAKVCCAATFSKSIKMSFMLREGTFRLMFQRALDLSIVIFRCRSTWSYRIARRPLSIIRASSGRVTMSYSRDIPPMWYEASTSPTRAGCPVRSGKMACGSRAARSRVG